MPVQAASLRRRRGCWLTLPLALLAGGCANGPSINPIDWWHGLEGGKIAEDRPPPPNVDQPYPSLGTVPPRPPPADSKQLLRIANGLIADRANAQYEDKISPLPAPPAAPAKTPNVVPPPGAADTSNATLAAASAPPAPPKAAPAGTVTSSDLAPPAAVAGGAAPAAADAPMPVVPTSPPPPPVLAGVPAVIAPTPPPATPPPPPPPPHVLRPGEPLPIAFAAGSAALPSAALPGLKALAAARGAGIINVVGYGDAASNDPAVQAAALPLAFARAQAVAAQLQSDGVPLFALRTNAEAAGTGAAARNTL